MPHLTVELSSEICDQLALQAKRSGLKDPALLAAQIIAERVENRALNEIRLELRKLRLDLASATKAILVTANDVDQDKALQWVEKMRRD